MTRIDCVRLAHQLGYRVVDGLLYSKKRKAPIKGWIDSNGYKAFSLRIPVSLSQGKRVSKTIPFHRLVAYQKYGEEVFKPGVVTRHLDGNPLNNRDDNIAIGTHQDNMLDKPAAMRMRYAVNASSRNRILSDEQVKQLKYDRFVLGLTYQELSDKYDIGSKGHAYYVANHQYVTEKTNAALC